MKKTTLNGKDYDLVIIDGNIVAQSPDHDLVFENAYAEMEREAEKFWVNEFGSKFMPGDYLTEFIDNRIPYYCMENIHKAITVTYNLN